MILDHSQQIGFATGAKFDIGKQSHAKDNKKR